MVWEPPPPTQAREKNFLHRTAIFLPVLGVVRAGAGFHGNGPRGSGTPLRPRGDGLRQPLNSTLVGKPLFTVAQSARIFFDQPQTTSRALLGCQIGQFSSALRARAYLFLRAADRPGGVGGFS